MVVFYPILDYEFQALKEASNLTLTEINNFLDEVEKIPSHKSPISGKTTRLAFKFMEDVGSRVNETIHIRKQDIDFSTRVVTIIMPKSEKHCKCSRWKNKDEYSQAKILEYADPLCSICHGKGKWKKPQTTTFTPRLRQELYEYCSSLQNPEELLFPVSRQSLWKWGKQAGINAKIMIFQQKDEKKIEGIFLHLFRALCSLRTTRDSKDDLFQNQLIDRKMRHSINLRDRYNKVDINYLINWEEKTYSYN